MESMYSLLPAQVGQSHRRWIICRLVFYIGTKWVYTIAYRAFDFGRSKNWFTLIPYASIRTEDLISLAQLELGRDHDIQKLSSSCATFHIGLDCSMRGHLSQTQPELLSVRTGDSRKAYF